jgi:hypothetical protein
MIFSENRFTPDDAPGAGFVFGGRRPALQTSRQGFTIKTFRQE